MNDLNSNENEERQEEVTQPEEILQETEASEGPQQSWKEVNLKLKKQAEDMERLKTENDLYQKFLNQREQQQVQPLAAVDNFDVNQLPDDDITENKDIKRWARQRDRFRAEEKEKENTRYTALEDRLILSEMRNEHTDFNTIFTKDNMTRLREMDPDLADSIFRDSDKAKQTRMAYSAIKRYGIAKPEANRREAATAEYNTSRPKPSNSVMPSSGRSALSQAGAFTDGPMTKAKMQEVFKAARQKVRDGGL